MCGGAFGTAAPPHIGQTASPFSPTPPLPLPTPPQGPHFQLVPDPWDRDVLYSPTLGEVADPRFLITGLRAADGRLVPGLFDADSWQETLSKWATTVVAGRAKLGGLPVGIIAVETRTQVWARVRDRGGGGLKWV